MDDQAQLSEFLHLMGDLRRASHRGFSQTVTECPRCHFPMLERLHFSIEKYGCDGAVYVSDLTRLWQSAPSAISRDLRTLEQDGYIRRMPDPADRRKTLVELTPDGARVREECHRAMRGYLHGVLTRMGGENVRRISADMRLAIDAINAECDARMKRRQTPTDFEEDTLC